MDLLRFLLLGSRGGWNRGRILELLLECPRNAHDLSKELDLNYGTVSLHLKTLLEAGLVVALTPERYAQGFAAAPVLRKNLREFQRLRRERKAWSDPASRLVSTGSVR